MPPGRRDHISRKALICPHSVSPDCVVSRVRSMGARDRVGHIERKPRNLNGVLQRTAENAARIRHSLSRRECHLGYAEENFLGFNPSVSNHQNRQAVEQIIHRASRSLSEAAGRVQPGANQLHNFWRTRKLAMTAGT